MGAIEWGACMKAFALFYAALTIATFALPFLILPWLVCSGIAMAVYRKP